MTTEDDNRQWRLLGRIETLCEENGKAILVLTSHVAKVSETLPTLQTRADCAKIEDAQANALQIVVSEQELLRRRVRYVAIGLLLAAGGGGAAGGALKDVIMQTIRGFLQ